MQNELMEAGMAPNSLKALKAALVVFAKYCAAFNAIAFPTSPETVKQFITWAVRIRKYRLETVSLTLWALRKQHVDAHMTAPIDESVSAFWANTRRVIKEPRRAKRALTVDQLQRVSRRLLSDHPLDIRNRAMLTVGFASAMRRSELAALQIDDITLTQKGLAITIRSSKTDQRAQGQILAVPFAKDEMLCPVRTIERWIAARGSWPGPLFVRFNGQRQATRKALKPPAVAAVLKKGLADIGIEPREYGAHSLRAGMATAAAESGASVIAIQMRTRHRNLESVLRYVRPAQAFQGDPLAGVL